MSDYSVAVKLSLVDHVSSGLVMMAAKFGMVTKQFEAFQNKLNSLQFQAKLGAGMVAFGAAIAAPLTLALKQAGHFEQQLFVIKTATQANVSEMDNYRKAIERVAVSQNSIFTSMKIAEMGKIIATTGNFKITELAQVTELFTKFATVQNILKGTSAEQSTKLGLQLAEITGHFDAKSVGNSLNLLTKLGLIMPDNIQQVLGSMKYMQGTVKNVMGVEDEQGMLFIAMLNRMGISGTRAGSMLTSAISRSIPGVMGSGLWEGKSPQALARMGMVDGAGHPAYFNDAGKFDAVKWMSLMGKYVKNEFAANPSNVARENIMRNFQFAYGANGARIAGLMSSPEALQQFKMLENVVKMYPDMDKILEQMQGLYVVQLPKAMANLNTAFTKFGYTLLPLATKWLGYFNNNFDELILFMQTHEDTIRSFVEGFAWIAGLSILGGTMLMVKAALGGLFIPLQMLLAILPNVRAAMLAFNLPLLLVAGGAALFIYAMYKVAQNWDALIASFQQTWIFPYLEKAFYALGYVMWHMIHPIETLKEAFNSLYAFFTNMYQKIFNFVNNPLGGGGSDKVHSNITGIQYGNPAAAQGFLSPNTPYVKNSIHGMQTDAAPNGKKQTAQNQPIQVNLHVDGHRMASVVANHISNQAMNIPNTTSLFDTALSPMPPVVNAIGIS